MLIYLVAEAYNLAYLYLKADSKLVSYRSTLKEQQIHIPLSLNYERGLCNTRSITPFNDVFYRRVELLY